MRALLVAYPARLRRRHGSELIATMLEMAGPVGRPSRADRWHLVADGLRERFRLPPGRPLAVVFALLAVLIGGGLGAAAGSWAGMWTFPSLPAPGPIAERVMSADARPESATSQRLWFDASGHLTGGQDATGAAGRARERLIADGWAATPVVVSGGGETFRRADFQAETDGVRIDVRAYYDDSGLVSIRGWSLRPPAYLPLVFGGLLLGLLVGWLLAAAMTYRIVGAGRRRASALLAAAGLALLLVPAASVLEYLRLCLTAGADSGAGELVHRALASGPVEVFQLFRWFDPNWPASNKVLLFAGLGTAVIAAVVARPDRSEPADPQPV